MKWMFVSHRRRKRGVYQARKPFGNSPCIWRDDLSMFSVNLHHDSLDATEKEAKSAFLVGLLGSPSWETRPLAKADISSSPLLLNRLLSPGVLTQHSKLGRDQKRYRLFPHSASGWHPLECTSEGSKVLSKCKNLVATLFITSRSKEFSRSDKGSKHLSSWESSPPSTGHSDLFALHQLFRERPESSESDWPISTLQAPVSSITPPQPALVLPCQPIAPRVVKREADHADPINHPLACSSLKTFRRDSLLSHCHPVLLDSSISLPATPLVLNTLPQALSEENLYFRATAHPNSTDLAIFQAPAIPASVSSPRDRVNFSPRLRPSPLRNMFLPSEGKDPVKSIQELCANGVSIDHQTDDAREDDLVHLLASLSPGTTLDYRHDLVPTVSNEQSTPKLRGRPSRKDQPDNLVTFLEELVQATSAWDDSLFLDSNFRAMIDSSKPMRSSPLEIRLKKSRPMRKRRMSFIFLEDIPEVDGEFFSMDVEDVPILSDTQ